MAVTPRTARASPRFPAPPPHSPRSRARDPPPPGDQPFQSPDRSVWMVCNGEIYNAPELRRDCATAGYPFRSKGDIETIVPLYVRLGPDGVSRLEGMFGLAVWDDRSQRLT